MTYAPMTPIHPRALVQTVRSHKHTESYVS